MLSVPLLNVLIHVLQELYDSSFTFKCLIHLGYILIYENYEYILIFLLKALFSALLHLWLWDELYHPKNKC